MPDSNFAELRRVRAEMSARVDHDIRRYVQMINEMREQYRDRLVNHGAEAETSVETELPREGQRSP